MKIISFLRALSGAFFFALSSGALAQNVGTVTNHAVPIGKGAGTQGFKSVGPCTTQYTLIFAGASADPACGQVSLSAGVTGTLPVANGGTGTTTVLAALQAWGLQVPNLAHKTVPVGADLVGFYDVAGTAYKYATLTELLGAVVSGVPTFNGAAGAAVAYFPPQVRLTLTSGTQVMTTSVAGATTVYVTPAAGGNMVPIYNGTNVVMVAFAEVSQATTDATKSPAAATTNSNYDVFCWVDAGTNRCTRGPAWTSDTGRGTGAGTTELDFTSVPGLPLNKIAITNGPAASRGTYVGTIRTNGSSTVDHIYGALAAGGTAGVFNVWNAYNRVNQSTMVRDNTDTWTYAVATTWRAPNGSATMRVSMVRGLDEDAVQATYAAIAVSGASALPAAGIGVDSTTAFSGVTGVGFSSSFALPVTGMYAGTPGIGFHYVSAIEWNTTATSSTWLGDFGTAYTQTGLTVSFRY